MGFNVNKVKTIKGKMDMLLQMFSDVRELDDRKNCISLHF